MTSSSAEGMVPQRHQHAVLTEAGEAWIATYTLSRAAGFDDETAQRQAFAASDHARGVCDACGKPLGPEDRGPLHWACVAYEKALADLDAEGMTA